MKIIKKHRSLSNQPPALFHKIQYEMDPLAFGLSKHKKFTTTQATPWITPYYKLHKLSTQAFHYKKTEKDLERSQDILKEDAVDKKMICSRSTTVFPSIIQTNTTLINPNFAPRIFYPWKSQMLQPRLQSQNNTIYKTILQEQDILANRPALLNQIEKLKSMGLLRDYQRNVKRMKGQQKVEYVYNDFHSKATNPGYARNGLGSFYTS